MIDIDILDNIPSFSLDLRMIYTWAINVILKKRTNKVLFFLYTNQNYVVGFTSYSSGLFAGAVERKTVS